MPIAKYLSVQMPWATQSHFTIYVNKIIRHYCMSLSLIVFWNFSITMSNFSGREPFCKL